MYPYFFFFLILFFTAEFSSSAWEAVKLQPPEKYTVAYAAVEGPDSFGARWSSLIRNRMTAIKNHILDEEEKKTIIENIRITALYELSKKLSETQNELAETRLKQTASNQGREYTLFMEQEKLKSRIKKLKKQKAPDIPDSLEINITSEENPYHSDFNILFPEVSLWLYGRASPLSRGVYYFEYYAYDVLREKRHTLLKQTISEEELPKIVEEVSRRLRGLLLGRPWGALELHSSTSGTRYYLNEKEVSDPGMLDILIPGRYTLRVRTPGHKTEEHNIEVKAGMKTSLRFTPEALPDSGRFIESNPAGAQVYLDGEYIGKTPLKITADEGQILYLHLDNYQPLFFTINDKPKLFFTLFANEADRQKKIDEAKDLFYTSFGMFIVSLAAPIAMYTMQRNLTDKSNILAFRGDTAGAQQAQRQAGVYGLAFWSTSGVSAGLLGWTIYQLVHYVRTSAKDG